MLLLVLPVRSLCT